MLSGRRHDFRAAEPLEPCDLEGTPAVSGFWHDDHKRRLFLAVSAHAGEQCADQAAGEARRPPHHGPLANLSLPVKDCPASVRTASLLVLAPFSPCAD